MLYLLLVFLKSAVMKTKVIFSLFAAIVLGLNCSFAQVYPSFDDDSYVESVKLKGQKPTIVDFVNNYLSDAEGEPLKLALKLNLGLSILPLAMTVRTGTMKKAERRLF